MLGEQGLLTIFADLEAAGTPELLESIYRRVRGSERQEAGRVVLRWRVTIR